ncbi:uncharacterized protein LOC113638042 isoform X2 [Tachysurus fulvidraco]|uniref:uncharacterized protein LOC113638042 isoform X2 n=1 Tax=Tachysurus fulvidraco TaxID=1234273 RepID=UPI001FEDD258|nr:uncharacterized protein LOC113638042 isoform X2 [Tachysurus fulvidraco]
MTKLQLLHRALNERLMAAVEQIMEMVGGTVLEYEEETVRARKENEILRRRLRWMEGENPTDWPDPAFSVPGDSSLTDTLALESLIIKTEPIDSHDFQLYGPDTSLTASVCTANIEVVYPGTSAAAEAGIPDSIVWDSAQSYMAPLDFDPTLSTMARNRSQRRSFACPDCGKVFGREQRLMFHMRIHSTERPYTYRRRKTCFYGDKKRKKKLRGLSKTSREFIEDLSDTSEQTEQSNGSANVGISASAGPSAPEVEPSEASDEASEHTTSSSKLSETSAARSVGLKSKQGREKPKTAQCLQCNRAFTNVSRLAVHMKTHSKPLPSPDEQNLQGDTESGSQHLPKVIRNNETEVEKAKAIGQRLFQCPECKKIFARSCWLTFHLKSHERERKRQKKKQLQNNKLKDVPQVSEKLKKDVATDSSKVHVLKKIFACPYCDKVFAREGWLGPHIRSHTLKNQNNDVISDAIMPNSTKRRTRRVVNKASKEGGIGQKKITEQSLGESEDLEMVNEQPKNKTSVSKHITVDLITNPKSETMITNNSEDGSNKSEIEKLTNTIAEESTPVPEEPTPVPEETSGQKEGVKKSKKRFPCRECGKVYLLAGWLKTHKKMHKKERLLEENRRRLMMKEFGQNVKKEEGQSLVETDVVEKKQKKKKKTLGLQESLDDKKKKKNQLTNAMLLETMDNSSVVQTAADKSKETGGETRGQCVCKDCGKVYARKNWLSLHMLGHRKALMALPQKANDKAPKSDSQTTEEGSATEDSKGQKGKDGNKATFPCPFCDKVFPRAMRLMVHMQIHSGEKPYSYRQRKEQFYSEPTRPRVPDTDKQEPTVEGNDEKGKDGGNEVTRSQTSAVSQDHASTTEPVETIQPQSVCTGRKFSLLPLQSSVAATIHSTALTRTETKADSSFSLQPRIVLDPVVAEAGHSTSSEGGDFKPVIVETSDIHMHQMPDLETNYAATGEQVKSPHAQTTLENSNPYTCQNTLAETDHPDVVCVKVGFPHTYEENSFSKKLLFSLGDQQSSESSEYRKSDMCLKKGQVESREYSLLDVKQHKGFCDTEHLEMDVESQQSGSQMHTHRTSRCLGGVKAKNITPHSGYQKYAIDGACFSDKKFTDIDLTTDPEVKSSSSALEQVSHTESGYMILSDVSDDDEWANVFNNHDEEGRKTLKIYTPLSEGSADAGSVPSSSHKTSDSKSTVTFMLEKTGDQNVLNGPLTYRDELAATSVQQTEEPSSTGQKRWFTCLACGLSFAGEASLTQHMKVHSVSTESYQKSNAFKTLKKRVKNNETKLKQEVVQVQTSEVGSADSRDNSEISGKSDSTLINFNNKLPGSCPDFGATSRSSRADSKTVDRKLKKEKGTLHCCYCGKAYEKIELHLLHDHPKEPKVIEALHCSNTLEERKRLLSVLCSHKKLKPTTNNKDEDLVRCIICQGYYQQNHFWKHGLVCQQKQSKDLFIHTEPGRGTDLPNTNLRSSLAQKTFHPESGNLIKDIFCSSVQQTIPESVKRSSAKAEHHTTHYLYSVSESGRTYVNPIPDHGSESLSVIYTGNSSTMMNLDAKSSGPLILDSLCSALEFTDIPVQEFCPHNGQEALVKNQILTPRTNSISEEECQSVLEPENRLNNILQTHTPVSYLLNTRNSKLQQNPEQDGQSSSTLALDCSGKPATPQETVSHIHTGSNDLPPTTNLKSDWTAVSTVHVDLEQNLASNTEPERTTIMMLEVRSERSDQSNPHSESTNCLIANIFSSEAQEIADPETGNSSIQVFGNDEHRSSEVESHCCLIPSHIPREKQHAANSEMYSAAKKVKTEGQNRDGTEEGDACSVQDSDLKPLGLNFTATVKRRWDSGSRETKRRRQSDPLQQTSTEERKASPVNSKTPEMKCGLQISDVWNSLKNTRRKAKIKLKKKHYCLYCKKPSIRMAQHLLSAHANEPEVAKALSYDKKSKERKQLLDLLQSKGSLLHKDVGSKTLMSSNRHAKAGSNRDGVQCIYCLGLYSRKVIINHVKRCKHEYPYRAEAGTVSPLASNTAFQPGASLSNRQLTVNQESLTNSHGSCKAKQEKPNPECLSSHDSDTQHSVAQLYADTESAASPCEDFELVNEQLFAELESHDFTPNTRKDNMNKNTTCSSPGDDQYETSKSEDKETDSDLNSRNGHTLENRRSFHSQSKVMDAPSDEEESAGLNTQLHVCQHCSATFCSPYHLRRHEYTHTGERPFWCSECNVGFIQKYRYRNHRMIHHEQHISGNKDQSRRRKKRSCSGERPAESELHQQLAESNAGTPEPFFILPTKDFDSTNSTEDT